jgi:tRNA wybutosine-synthesizing protein 2
VEYDLFFPMPLRDRIREFLTEHQLIDASLLEYVPTGFQQLGHSAIVNFRPELKDHYAKIAEAIMAISPQIKAVWAREGTIQGDFRQPTGLKHIAGDPTTEIIITENNIRYKFDFTKIMFAKGNVTERALLPKKVQPHEIIIDMFSGIGYFTLGMAKTRKPDRIYAIEWNPVSHQYLKENLKLNHVENIVTPIHGDCKEEVPKLAQQGIFANRILMGLLPAPKDSIPAALTAIHPDGTIVLYEGIEPEISTELFDEFKTIAMTQGFNCELLERRIVKSYAPKVFHVTVEILVKKKSN